MPNKEKNTRELHIAQKGFAFTLKPRLKVVNGIKCGAVTEQPDYLVIGHQTGDERYYIECYHSIHEGDFKIFQFSAEITGKGGYSALEESVLQFINEYDSGCNTAVETKTVRKARKTHI